MTYDTTEKSHTILKILTNVGVLTNDQLVWSSQFPQIPPIIYSILIHAPLTFTFTILMWLDVIFSTDLMQALDILYIALTETALVVKIVSIWYYGALAKSMFNEWQTNKMFELKTLQEHLMWQGGFKIFFKVANIYIGCSLGVVTSAFVGVVLFNAYQQLPFPFWTPFSLEKPTYYWCAFFYELFAMPLTCLSNCTTDMFLCYMMQHLALCFKLIAMRLENLGKRTMEANENITESLREIIELHQNVKRMSKHCEAIVSYPILTQILLSALVLCFSLYRLQNVNFTQDPNDFVILVQYCFVMTLQIFLPCYYGNEVFVESSRIFVRIYNSNWTEMSPYNRRMVMLFMQYLQKPVIFRAGLFFDIGLTAFTKTMNNAYSIFALLLNMDKEE